MVFTQALPSLILSHQPDSHNPPKAARTMLIHEKTRYITNAGFPHKSLPAKLNGNVGQSLGACL